MAKLGRKKVDVDYKVLDALCQFRVRKDFVCDYLGVSLSTLEKRLNEDFGMTFTEYNELKMQRTGLKLQQKAIDLALGGNVTMLIFSLKNIAGWSDKVELSGSEEAPIKTTFDIKNLVKKARQYKK